MLPKIVKAPAYVLDKPTEQIHNIDVGIQKLAKTLGLVLRLSKNGAALAANQIGISKRMFVYRDANGSMVTVINPLITLKSEEDIVDLEGCLSIPGKSFKIPRPSFIEVEYTTINGSVVSTKMEGFWARLFCHEIDHLDGKLIDKELGRDYATEGVH